MQTLEGTISFEGWRYEVGLPGKSLLVLILKDYLDECLIEEAPTCEFITYQPVFYLPNWPAVKP